MEIKVSRADWKRAERTGHLSFTSLKPRPTFIKLTDAQYENLYWSGRGSRLAAAEFGGAHMRYIHAWRRLGLDTSIEPEKRKLMLPDPEPTTPL